MAIPDDLKSSVKTLEDFLDRDRRISARKAKTAWKDIKPYLEKKVVTPEQAPDDESQTKPLDEFFRVVGIGARKAQEDLDLQSVEYLKKRPAFAPGTMFRVPKVSAKLKLGMTVTKKKGINFLVIKKGTESSRSIEQEISFDILSAPPPPDTLEGIAELPIPPVLISSNFERNQVFERLRLETERLRAHDEEVSELIKTILKDERSRRVLVFRGSDAWTLMLVKPEEERERDTKLAPSQHSSVLVLPMDKDSKKLQRLIPNQRMNHFYDLLYRVADKQADLLEQLDRA